MIEVTLVLRPPEASKLRAERLLAGNYSPEAAKPEDIAAAPADVSNVTDFVGRHGLQVVKLDPAARTVRVAGSAEEIKAAFGPPGEIPASLKNSVIAILGLDLRPIAKHHGT